MRDHVSLVARLFPFVFACLAGSLHAQPPVDPLPSMVMPATATGAAALVGLAHPTDPASLTFDMIEKVYSSDNRQVRLLVTYLEAIERLEAVWQEVDPQNRGIAVKDGLVGSKREQFDKLLNAYGMERAGAPGAATITFSTTGAARELRRTLTMGGLDVATLARNWNDGRSAQLDLPATPVPSVLPVELWSGVVFDGRVTSRNLFRSIMTDRRAALLYYGLASLDDETIEYFASKPSLLKRVQHDRTSAFAAFGRSLRIQRGRVIVPGAPQSELVWQKLVGAPSQDADSFILSVLSRDDGRLAYFYDTLSHLDDGQVRFATGEQSDDPAHKFGLFSSLYDAFSRVTAESGSYTNEHVFQRASLDPAVFLFQVGVLESGQPREPSSLAFWESVFDTEDVSDHVDGRAVAVTVPYSPAWMIERIFAPVQQHRYDRFDAVMFAQRVFGSVQREAVTDAVAVLRGFGRYRALILSLERIGIRRPDIYAASVRRAAVIGATRQDDQGRVAESLFQGMLAIVERAFFTRRITAQQAEDLVRSAIAIETDDGRYLGGVANWIQHEVLEGLRLGPDVRDTKAPREGALLDLLAGVAQPQTGESVDTVFRWLDWSYRLDLTGELRSRMTAIRAKQGGNSLDQVLDVAAIARRLSAGTIDRDTARATIGSLRKLSESLEEPHGPRGRDERGPSVNATLRWSIAQLGTVRDSKDGKDLRPVARVLAQLGDVLLASTLRSIVYSTYLGNPAGPLLLGGDVAYRHDFGFTIKDYDTRLHAAWSLPEEPSGFGLNWQVWGALLGLDVGLVRLSLQQVTNRAPPAREGLSEANTKGLLQTLAIFNPFDRKDDELPEIAGRIQRGRERVSTLREHRATLDAIARELHLDGRRVGAIKWALVGQKAPSFSLLELFHLGRDRQSTVDLSGWGAPQLTWNGCLCLRIPPAAAWEPLRGRPQSGYLAASLPDMQLRIAVSLFELHLPAALAYPILVDSIQNLIDQAEINAQDDLAATARYAAQYPRERIESLISSLTATGILVPVTSDKLER